MMPDRPQYCAANVAAATGVCLQTCRNELNLLRKAGKIVAAARKVSGCTWYRTASTEEQEQITAAAAAERRAKGKAWMKENSEMIERRLKEV